MGSLLAEAGGLLLSWALGLALTRPFFDLSVTSTRLLWMSISLGFGTGLSSVVWFFLWLCPSFPPYVAGLGELALLIVIWRFGGKFLLSAGSPQITGPSLETESTFTRVVLAVGAACLILCLVYGWMFNWYVPDGEWDAWAIWNLHARMLARAPALWRSHLLQLPYSHPDYPLLQPLTTARLWMFAGEELPSATKLVTFVFGFSPILVVSSSLAVLKSWTHGAIALVFLAGSGSLVHLGISQYADSAVSLFLVSTFALLTAASVYQQKGLACLAGLSAGFGAWVKNEGALFVVALVLVALLLAIKPANRPQLKALTWPFIIGLILPALCLAVFRTLVPAPSDVMSWVLDWKRWTVGFRGKRIWLILKSFGNRIWKIEPWPLPPLAWVLIFFDTVGASGSGRALRSGIRGLAVLGVMVLGYVVIYATSAPDLVWYLNTSQQRLILQLWPAFIFLLFLLTGDPVGRAPRHIDNPSG